MLDGKQLNYQRLLFCLDRENFSCMKLVLAQFKKGTKEPEYLASILGKTNRQVRGGIIVENNKLGFARKSFTIRGAEQWNKLTSSLRMEQKLSKFKQGLRNWIADNVPRFLP